MDKDVQKRIEKCFASGNKKEFDEILETLTTDEKREVSIFIFMSFSKILKDSKLENTYTRAMLSYIIDSAQSRSDEKGVVVSYVDGKKIGLINKYAVVNNDPFDLRSEEEKRMEKGDEALKTIVHSIHEAFKGSDYNVIRLGGDEFLVVTVGEEIDIVNGRLDEAKTMARDTRIKYKLEGEEEAEICVGCSSGSAELDPKNHRGSIDKAEYASTDAGIKEEKARKLGLEVETKEKTAKQEPIIIDPDKQKSKKAAMRDYLTSLRLLKTSNIRKPEETRKIEYQVIDENLINDDKKEKESRQLSEDFVELLCEVVNATEKQKLELDDKFDKFDVETLVDNVWKFREQFVQERKISNCVRRDAASIVLSASSDIENLRTTYIELDNLKLVNSARGHSGGDKFIEDFLTLIQSSISESIPEEEAVNIIKMSGNGLVLKYDEKYSSLLEVIQKKADEYNTREKDSNGEYEYESQSFGITMDIYMSEMDQRITDINEFTTDYIKASERVNREKEEKNKYTKINGQTKGGKNYSKNNRGKKIEETKGFKDRHSKTNNKSQLNKKTNSRSKKRR